MAAVAPNASMGLLNLGGCGVLLPSLQPNSSAGHGFLVPRRDVSALPLSWGLVRRGRVLDAGFGAAGALASGEAGAGSSELRHIEKELTFSPTFTDYVKMMESVKLDRSKSLQGGDSDGRSSRRRFDGDGRREALNVFYTMLEQLSSYPDIAAYHCIAVTLGQAGLVKELFDVIDCMRSPPKKKFMVGPVQNWDPRLEPDLIVYNAVLNACVQQKQWEGTFWVLQQLKEKNIRPTNTTYGLVMEVMLVCGKYNLVYEFFDRVKQKSIPGALNYKVLVNALWREGKIDEAVMAVKDMENRGIVGSASLYYDLARCLCSGGRCKEALLQVEKICKVANKPLVVTYTGLIQICIDSGSIENAKYIFKEMCNYCSPNNVTCNIMLKSYIDHGMFEDAKDLLENILNGRIRSKADLDQQAIADKFTFNTFLDACAEAKKWNEFEYAFRKMLSNGYHFDERRHLRMVLDAYRSGKEQLLEDIWDYLCRNGRVPPAAMIMERFCLKLRQGHTTAALSCISSFQESKIGNVSSKSWSSLLNRNADLLEEESVAELVHKLDGLSRPGSPCNSLYENVMSGCTEFLGGSGGKAPSDGWVPFCNS